MVLLFEEKFNFEEDDSNEVWLGHFKRREKKSYHQYLRFCETVASIAEEDLE